MNYPFILIWWSLYDWNPQTKILMWFIWDIKVAQCLMDSWSEYSGYFKRLCSFKLYYWNLTCLCHSFAADPAIHWVLVISRVPDAQVIAERSSYTHGRLHRPRGSLSTCTVLSFANQGHQRGAAKTLPETTSHGRLPQLRNTVPNQTLAKLRPQLLTELADFKHAT